jgi:hypothetical protein
MFSRASVSAQSFAKLPTSLKKWQVTFPFPPPGPEPNPTNLFLTQIYASAVALSTATSTPELDEGRLYPELDRIRNVSVIVARAVIRAAQAEGLDREQSIRGFSDAELDEWIGGKMYDPTHQNGEEKGERVRGEPVKSLL